MSEVTQKELRVLFISAEAEPFARVGGLGDVGGALPRALRKLELTEPETRLDVRLILPYYGVIKKADYPVERVTEFDVPSRKGPVHAIVYETFYEGLPVYFVDGPAILPDDPVYGQDFQLDAEKFIFFSLASLQFPKEIGWPVQIIHANDWHSAIAIHALKRIRMTDSFYKSVKGIITIHNLPFMGTGSKKALSLFKVNSSRNPVMPPWSRSLPLPMGIDAADWILTVSPHYAQEILTPAFGCDLQDYLKTRLDHLSGILNGLDTDLWNPETDRSINTNFSASNLSARVANKVALQKELGLPVDPQIPLMAFVGRMELQKGADLVLQTLSKLKPHDWQAVILGTGKKDLQEGALLLEKQHPQNVRALLKFDSLLSHRVYAAADMLLMPSRYEPCGLSQMIAMRYGCIPVASATGGLVDSIENHTASKVGTGYLFDLELRQGLTKTLQRALRDFQDKASWLELQQNAMAQDHSWKFSALEYAHLYEWLVEH